VLVAEWAKFSANIAHVCFNFGHILETLAPSRMQFPEPCKCLPGNERPDIVHDQAPYWRIRSGCQHHSDQSAHRSADPINERSPLRRWAPDELGQRASPFLVSNKRKQGRRIGQILSETIILLVFKPIARAASDYIHANHSEMAGQSGSQTIEIPAVAS
jgi:hypothetical protein